MIFASTMQTPSSLFIVMKKFSSLLLVSVFLFAMPTSAHAITAYDALRGYGDEDVITRGDFVRAAVQVLGMENTSVDSNMELPYRRVAKALEPYVRVAHKKGALDAFGYDLLLAQGITRGEALRILVSLTGFSSSTAAVYKDVPAGSDEERAVRVAAERNWMTPITSDLYGIRRKLLGKDAILTLRKVGGEHVSQSQQTTETTQPDTQSETIRVNLGTTQRLMNLPKTQILETIWSVIEREFLYIDKVDTDEAAFKAAEGIVASLGDKYTTFMRPSRARQFQTQIQGEVTGIGAQVEYVDEVLTIVSPIKGSPAEAAGLEPGDQIIKVNGEELAGLSFLDAVEKVRGPQGSTVHLRVRRNGFELDVEVTRDVIKVPEAEISWQEDIAVIQLTQFGRITEEELRPEVQNIINKGPKGIVLDLRSNPGGLLSAADEVVSLFVHVGTPYVEVRTRKEDKFQYTTGTQVVPESIPVVVLINEGSASASEIVAGALQDMDRATIIGAKSFGKGTVQQVLQFNDQSSLKMTIAEWYTPDGNKIDGEGVHPDIGISEVDGRDAPLLKALEILR